MEVFLSPAALVALGTLVLLEVVLGIDNLLFIAILAEKLPPEQRDRARLIGLVLAMLMRLLLLSLISWVVSLKATLFVVWGQPFSWRDIILFIGGLFLLFKATRELHERLEGAPHSLAAQQNYAGFWQVVAQIVVLDAVFSLDAVITAVGMVDHLPIMMLAVILAVGVMALAARPLARFINAHPSVVVLCLSFLLLIGFSLLAEGLGFSVPKGYLYAAIGFSVLIEMFNQMATRNERKHQGFKPLRLRTAEALLRIMGTELQSNETASTHEGEKNGGKQSIVPRRFAEEEVDMVSRVLTLSERTARSLMTYRGETVYLNIELPAIQLQQQLYEGTPDIVPLCRGDLDHVVGVAYAVDVLADLTRFQKIQPETMHEPIIIPESMRAPKLLHTLQKSRMHIALVGDEYGSIEGVVTLMDILEAITGALPEDGEVPPIVSLGDGKWQMEGSTDIHYFQHFLGVEGIADEANNYTTLAGFILYELGRLPEVGECVRHNNFLFRVAEVEGRRIALVDVEKLPHGSKKNNRPQ